MYRQDKDIDVHNLSAEDMEKLAGVFSKAKENTRLIKDWLFAPKKPSAFQDLTGSLAKGFNTLSGKDITRAQRNIDNYRNAVSRSRFGLFSTPNNLKEYEANMAGLQDTLRKNKLRTGLGLTAAAGAVGYGYAKGMMENPVNIDRMENIDNMMERYDDYTSLYDTVPPAYKQAAIEQSPNESRTYTGYEQGSYGVNLNPHYEQTEAPPNIPVDQRQPFEQEPPQYGDYYDYQEYALNGQTTPDRTNRPVAPTATDSTVKKAHMLTGDPVLNDLMYMANELGFDVEVTKIAMVNPLKYLRGMPPVPTEAVKPGNRLLGTAAAIAALGGAAYGVSSLSSKGGFAKPLYRE